MFHVSPHQKLKHEKNDETCIILELSQDTKFSMLVLVIVVVAVTVSMVTSQRGTVASPEFTVSPAKPASTDAEASTVDMLETSSLC